MIEPRRALVRPRVLSPITGEALLLGDVVFDELRQRRGLPIQILGGPGSGKTTALAHLAAVLAESAEFAHLDLIFVDEPDRFNNITSHSTKTLVTTFSIPNLQFVPDWFTVRLAPWSEDDVMEYLLAAHKTRCGEIHSELRKCDLSQLEGIPQLWTLVLDALAEDRAKLPPLTSVLLTAMLEKVTGAAAIEIAGLCAIHSLRNDIPAAVNLMKLFEREGVSADSVSLLRHAPVHRELAVGRIRDDLAGGFACAYLGVPLPRALVCAVAARIAGEPAAAAHLRQLLTVDVESRHPMAASICHQLDRQWIKKLPKSIKIPRLAGAYLDHADWPDVDLRKSVLAKADFRSANLAGATLKHAAAEEANFEGATLAKADLRNLKANEANFSGADLREANGLRAELGEAIFVNARLDGATFSSCDFGGSDFTRATLAGGQFDGASFALAKFEGADLTGANFSSAKFARNDFRTARLDETCWAGATFSGSCNFEDVTARDVDFDEADLSGSLWTGSTLSNATFARARLTNAGLADIDWEGADLRDADFNGASFHLGSSRSGLVGSPIAREGSMTGFYSDDFAEQDFKSPEEIRKANLRRADLRGADVWGVDFYLVDLRDANYSEEQAAHFRACGAILWTRGEPAE